MARTKGMLNLSGNLEVNAQAPLDARTIVPTEADLTVANNFPYPYVGLEVYVTGTGKKFRLVNLDTTQSSSWQEIGEGGGSGTSDYSDLTNKPQINGNTLSGNKTTSDLGLQEVQKSTMPTAVASLVGQIVQYTGASDANYTKGYYYQCVENSGVYSWANIAVQPVSGFDYSNEFGAENIYSTQERMIGQWTDGKPLYQKCLIPEDDASGLNNNQWTIVLNNALGIGVVDKVITIRGVIYNGSKNQVFEQPDATSRYEYHKENDQIAVWVSSDWAHRPDFILIQYTKTTDSAMSIGVANEYSTTEKIVGTWIDGKPLYQKVISYTMNNESEAYLPIGASVDHIHYDAYYNKGTLTFSSYMLNDGMQYYFKVTAIDNTDVEHPNTIKIKTNSTEWQTAKVTVILRYTKTS